MLRIRLIALAVMMVASVSAQPYVDVTEAAGLGVILRASGAAVADVDLDGDLDLFTVSPEEYDPADSLTWNHLLLNRGDGSFEDVTAQSGIEPHDGGYRRGQMGNRMGASWGDYNGDRYPDLFLARIGPDRLYRNLGDGRFEDVTAVSGVFGTDDTANDMSGSWADMDGDGDLDLYVSSWIGPNRLYLNQGNDSFEEVAEAAGVVDNGFSWSALPWDVNRDGLMDLYVVNDFGPNRLYVQGDGFQFVEATAAFGLEDEGNGMGVALTDLNLDGHPDIYITNIADRFPNPLFLGGDQGFVERAADYGIEDAAWAWGVEFFDADHDGDQDLYVVNGFPTDPSPNKFFERQQGGGGEIRFADRSEATGTDGSAEARSLIVFDREGDGDLDLFVGNFREPSVLLERADPSGNWLGIWLDHPPPNRWGVGSVVTVEGGGQTQRRYMDGIDFLGQSLLPAHFGLGSAGRVDRITVQWPDGQSEEWSGIPASQYHTLTRGTGGSPVGVEATSPALADGLVYPNPATSSVSIPLPEGWVTVYDMLGRRWGSRRVSGGSLELSGMPRGLLALRLPDERVLTLIHR